MSYTKSLIFFYGVPYKPLDLSKSDPCCIVVYTITLDFIRSLAQITLTSDIPTHFIDYLGTPYNIRSLQVKIRKTRCHRKKTGVKWGPFALALEQTQRWKQTSQSPLDCNASSSTSAKPQYRCRGTDHPWDALVALRPATSSITDVAKSRTLPCTSDLSKILAMTVNWLDGAGKK